MEFAAGMVLGQLAQQDAQPTESRFFSRTVLVAGLATYALGVASYNSLGAYVFTDALTGIFGERMRHMGLLKFDN